MFTRDQFQTDPNGSKWIRSENRTGQAFCLHGTFMEPVRNGSKTGPKRFLETEAGSVRFGTVPLRFRVNVAVVTYLTFFYRNK